LSGIWFASYFFEASSLFFGRESGEKKKGRGRKGATRRHSFLLFFVSRVSTAAAAFLLRPLDLSTSQPRPPLFQTNQPTSLSSITVAGKPVAVVSDPALLVEASALPKPAEKHRCGTSAALSGAAALESVADISSTSSASSAPAAVRSAFDSSCSKEAAAAPGGYLDALANAGDALTAALVGAGPDEAVDMGDLLERAAIDAALAGAAGVSPSSPAAAALDSAAFKARRPQPQHELLSAIRAARAATPATSMLSCPASSSACPAAAAPAVAELKAKFADLATELESRGAPKACDASAGAALVRSGLSGEELAANLSTAVLHGKVFEF